MQTSNIDTNISNPYATHNANVNTYSPQNKQEANKKAELSIEEEVKKSAVQVSISMNAQIVLFSMDSSKVAKDNSTAQKDVFNLLSGKEIEGSYSLEDIGYNGKPITELTEDEAKELISEEGFFSVEETSTRVADFVFNFAGYDIDLLEKGRAGIVQGFEEANKLWGGELPEISHATQEATLAILDARIADLKNKSTV